MTNMQKQRIDKQHGFSLIEIMVGLVIGLIGTIVIFQVFSISEGQKRTTTAGNDANQNGIFALYTLERQLRMGGGGIVNAQNALGCLINASYENNVVLPAASAASLPAPFNTLGANVRAAPLLIQDGGGAASDNIIVMSGNSSTAGVAVAFKGTGTTATVSNSVGFKKGDLFLAASRIQVGKPEIPRPCFIGQMSSDPVAGDDVIGLDSSGKHNAASGINTLGQFYDGINLGQAGLLGFGITSSATNRFELVSYNFLTGGTTQPIADNIVNLQALYGVDNGAAPGVAAEDGIIDTWVPPTGNWSYATLSDGSILASDKLRKIKAVRLAVVARSALPEKREGGNPVTPANWTLFATGPGSGAGTVAGTLTNDEQDYRYKIFETVIPLRNMLIQQCTIEDRSRGFCNPTL